LREQLEANWQKIKEQEEEERAAEQEEEEGDEENLVEDEETAADEDFVFGQPSGSSNNDNIDKINDFVKHYNEMHQSISPQLYEPIGTQYAENTYTTTATDADYAKPTTYEDFISSDAYKRLHQLHIEAEGYNRTIDENGLVFPYPDINRDITGCVGHNMKDDFTSHPWIDINNSNQFMAPDKIVGTEEILKNIRTDLKPELYAQKIDARLPQKYCEDLYNKDIKSRWDKLSNVIPNWSSMSPEMQAATMDVHYTGNMAPSNKWTSAKQAATNKNEEEYCENLHRKDVKRPDVTKRNKWVADMCKKGRFFK